jgi:Ca2+:H+ antiporter
MFNNIITISSYILHMIAVIAVILSFTHVNDITVCVLCFIGLIPIAGKIGDVTEWISEKTNPITAGIVNAALGNAPELAFGLASLFRYEDELLKGICYGSVLSNMLLVLGSAIIAGHVRQWQRSIVKYSAIHRSGGATAVVCFAGYLFSYIYNLTYPTNTSQQRSLDLTISILLLANYIINMIWTFDVVNKIDNINKQINNSTDTPTPEVLTNFISPIAVSTPAMSTTLRLPSPNQNTMKTLTNQNTMKSFTNQIIPLVEFQDKNNASITETSVIPTEKDIEANKNEANTNENDMNENDVPSWKVIIFWLVYSTVIVALLSNGITDRIAKLAAQSGIGDRFIGGVIIAILGNACEHYSSLKTAYDGDMDAAIQIPIASSLQISTFLYPLFVIISTSRTKFLGQNPDTIFMIPLIICSIAVSQVLQYDNLNIYLGILLVSLYIMIAVLFYIS